MNDSEWCLLVDAAMASAPDQLLIALERWAHDFERAECGVPVEADYPEPVRAFFRCIAPAFRTGRPCRDEKILFAAKNAWLTAAYGRVYETQLFWLQLSRESGIPFNGVTAVGLGDTPSELALENIANQPGAKMQVERLRDIVFPRRKKRKKCQ